MSSMCVMKVAMGPTYSVNQGRNKTACFARVISSGLRVTAMYGALSLDLDWL